MKYYYTDPLAAAWMEDKFGMKFVDDRGLNVTIYDLYTDGYFISGDVGNYTESPDKAYVSPDSLHLLEPQLGDVISSRDKFEGDIGKWTNQAYKPPKPVKIHERNGIAFMMPEVEV